MNLYDIYETNKKKRVGIPTIIKYIYKNEENKTINESTMTEDRITHLTNTNVLENKHSNNDSYYLKDNTKELETPYEYQV